MRSVAVIGAGITGLATAFALKRRGVDVIVYEASSHAGGVMRTVHRDGFLAEDGPNSFVSSPDVATLLSELDLSDDVITALPTARQRYVLRDGVLRAFPLSPPALLSTRLFSARAKLRILLEPVVRRRAATGAEASDESVASFVRRRLGTEVLDYAVDPFVSGIFAGDPEALSMAHAFPRVAALEATYGSLSKGLLGQLSARRAARVRTSDGARDAAPDVVASRVPSTGLISFADGLQSLPDALVSALSGAVRLDTPLQVLDGVEGRRWRLESSARPPHTVDACVLAVPAHVLSAIELPAALRPVAAPIASVEYPPVRTVTLGFKRDAVAHPLDGFGMLIPSRERRTILGTLFTSSLFAGRAPTNHVCLTSFVGGARHPEYALERESAAVERVMAELSSLLGITEEPRFVHQALWPRAIPQYAIGYDAVKNAVAHIEAQHAGLFLAGNYHRGVSVGDCISSARTIAGRVADYLAGIPA